MASKRTRRNSKTLQKWDRNSKSTASDNAVRKRNEAIQKRTAAGTELGAAQKAVRTAQDALEAEVERISQLGDKAEQDAENTKDGGPYKMRANELGSAKRRAKNAKTNASKLTREILPFSVPPGVTNELPKEIDYSKIKLLKAEEYGKLVTALLRRLSSIHVLQLMLNVAMDTYQAPYLAPYLIPNNSVYTAFI
ncbi:hypothetical protein CC80DRAFT_566485 [Byssothecium circinans]|uniref:Uncharacterized protein n=1 Tax=Byssothecium circinans TaxID=147558 RepID=A0A6A5U1N3_9PLEO|nr:hypothetical protein CC80DRAFT_566485 [Byssothecium circinans]